MVRQDLRKSPRGMWSWEKLRCNAAGFSLEEAMNQGMPVSSGSYRDQEASLEKAPPAMCVRLCNCEALHNQKMSNFVV